MSKADLTKKPQEVAAMFDEVAKSYDFANDLLSFGQSRFWRRQVARQVGAKSGEAVLDIAAGTGSSSIAFLAPGVRVVAADFSNGMLQQGRIRHPELEFVYADATKLPFDDASFDVVTISFGLRNVVDPDLALREMLRVLRPGGRLVICEFSSIPLRPLQAIYRFYLKLVLPVFSRLLSRVPEAYSYLAESIDAWPNQQQLAKNISAAGFSEVSFRNQTLGIVAIHSARKPRIQ